MIESALNISLQPDLILPVRLDVLLDRAELLLQPQELASVMNSRFDLLLVSDNTSIRHQSLDVLLAKLRDLWNREISERLVKIGPLVLDDTPVETRGENGLCQSLKIFIIIPRRFDVHGWHSWRC